MKTIILILCLSWTGAAQNLRSPGANRISSMNNWQAIDGHKLIAYWDFGVSLTDLWHGNAAALSGTATRTSAGVVFDASNGLITLPNGILAQAGQLTVFSTVSTPNPTVQAIFFDSGVDGVSDTWQASRAKGSHDIGNVWAGYLGARSRSPNYDTYYQGTLTGVTGLSVDSSKTTVWRQFTPANIDTGVTFSGSPNDSSWLGGLPNSAWFKNSTYYTAAIYNSSSVDARKYYDQMARLLAARSVTLPAPTWDRKGPVIMGSLAAEQAAAQEPTVINESNCQIVASPCFKMWYTGGYANPQIFYAESVDGISWIKRATPLLNHYYHAWVLKNGATYYFYGCKDNNTQIDLYTSSDGIAWTLDTADVIPLSGSGWDSVQFGNPAVIVDSDGVWKMLYECRDPATSTWKTGLATSPDPRTWTKYGSNPVITMAGPFLTKISGTYWAWGNDTNLGRSAGLGMVRFSSSDLHTWTPDTGSLSALAPDEGPGKVSGSIGDPHIVVVNGKIYLYYTAYPEAASAPYFIKLALMDGSFGSLVASKEGL